MTSVFAVFIRLTASDCTFGVCKLFLHDEHVPYILSLLYSSFIHYCIGWSLNLRSLLHHKEKFEDTKAAIRKRKLDDKQNNDIANPVYTLIFSNAGGFFNCFISYTGSYI